MDETIIFNFKGIKYQAIDCGIVTDSNSYKKRAKMFAIIKNNAFSKIIKEVFISYPKYHSITLENLIRSFKRKI